MNNFKVRRENGIVVVAEFNRGYSHIGVDDGCWVLMNNGTFSSWLFPEAMEELNKLPPSPNDYQPYVDFFEREAL